jgi:hypothetical protein
MSFRRATEDGSGSPHAGGVFWFLGWYLGDELKWNYFVGFGLMVTVVSLIFRKVVSGLEGSICGRLVASGTALQIELGAS